MRLISRAPIRVAVIPRPSLPNALFECLQYTLGKGDVGPSFKTLSLVDLSASLRDSRGLQRGLGLAFFQTDTEASSAELLYVGDF